MLEQPHPSPRPSGSPDQSNKLDQTFDNALFLCFLFVRTNMIWLIYTEVLASLVCNEYSYSIMNTHTYVVLFFG